MPSVHRIIQRSNVTPGAQDDTYRVNPVVAKAQTQRTVLSTEQVRSLDTESQPLTPTPSIGRSIEVLSVFVEKAAGGYAQPKPLSLRYGAEGEEVARIGAAILRDTDERTGWADLQPTGLGRPTGAAVTAAATDPYQGDGGELTITVRYVEVENG